LGVNFTGGFRSRTCPTLGLSSRNDIQPAEGAGMARKAVKARSML
jgi:hypothetical protein